MIKFGQLIEYQDKIFFFENHGESEAGKLVPDLFLLYKKVLCEVKAIGQQLSFNMFCWSSASTYY